VIRLIFCLLLASLAHAATPLSIQPPVERTWVALRGAATADASVRHNGNRSLRVEPSAGNPDASVCSAPVSLIIGRTYELTGWVRTEDLTVRDLDRSPIPAGAALTMASMPYDVHSASLGGTREWTRLLLRFVASRAQDRILLIAGQGGAFRGKAWFEGVSLDGVSPADSWPARDAVRTFGPAYRYPAAGWIFLHIEGKPYDRGYQHGYLMAKEIPEYLTRCAVDLAGKADRQSWNAYRTSANALFLRGFDREILEEMKGIADGANAAGAKFLGRKIDLIDVVVANTEVEMSELRAAMNMTPTGIEGVGFEAPPYAEKSAPSATDRCSAFAATGPATRDGKMVIGHVTWWPSTLAEQTNVMLDIKPSEGHRVLMQSYPGGIESGTDWYQNDVGVVLTETTIRQTPFNAQGTPVAFRARMAIQYGGNIDEVVRHLGTHNNGLYTNEWLIGDAKNDEIAMYELGTSHTKLWRSSKNEWFGGTPGFYWGDNNAKDLAVNLEYLPDPKGAPQYIPYVPAVRDLAWQGLYAKYKGQIDEQFAFTAFDSAPLVSASTMDAKVTTSALAMNQMVWAQIGRPNETIWKPRERATIPAEANQGLYPGGYYLFGAEPTEALSASIAENEKARLSAKPAKNEDKPKLVSYRNRDEALWKGWVLPASDADTWFVAGSAQLYRLLQSADVEKAIEAERIRYRGWKLAEDNPANSFRIEEVKGTLLLDALRRKIGDEAFLKLMEAYFAANTTRTVTAQSFLTAANVPLEFPDPGDGPAYLPGDIVRRLESAVIVYGTVREAGTNRYAAEEMQARFRDRNQREVPIYRDFEATDAMLAHKDVIFIGRPESDAALATWSGKIGLDYQSAVFRINGIAYASERNALVFAAKNPYDHAHMVLVYAGNAPLETVQSLSATAEAPWIVLENGKPTGPSALPKDPEN
jgi:Phospholipase B